MIQIRLFLALAICFLARPASGQYNAYHDVKSGLNQIVEDLDSDDGFDFVSAYSGSWKIKLSEYCSGGGASSNQIVDGGSRSTFNGNRLRKFSIFDSTENEHVITASDNTGQLVLWDRADFNQHIVEFHFQIGLSTVSLTFVADADKGDLAYGKMFVVGTPDYNYCDSPDMLPKFADAGEAASLYSEIKIEINAHPNQFGGAGRIEGTIDSYGQELVLFGDVDRDGSRTLLDVAPFVEHLQNGGYQIEADTNYCGLVDLLDVGPFVDLLSGGG